MAKAVLGIFVLAAAALAGCAGPGFGDSGLPPRTDYEERGDLSALRRHGLLRVLVPALGEAAGEAADPLAAERQTLTAWAAENKLEIAWIEVSARSQLIPMLLEGRGDLVAAGLTATPRRREHVGFTVPIDYVREQLITRRNDDTIHDTADLAGRSITVRHSSSYWRTLSDLRLEIPSITIEEAPEWTDTEDLLAQVAQRRLDLTVADSNLVETVMARRDDLRVGCDLTAERPIAWAVRPDATRLLESLNEFLIENHAASGRREVWIGGLEGIRERRVLRVLTRNSPSTYYLWRGQMMGFEYELAREFAASEGLRVEIVVPPRDEDLIDWLVQGRGDVVAAGLTPSEEAARQGVAFSRPYNTVTKVLVTRPDDTALDSLDDLTGRTIHLSRSGIFWQELEQLRADSGIPFELQAARGELEEEEIIDFVANNRYDLTVAYSHALDIERTWRDDVRGAFAVGDPVPLVWAVRKDDDSLRAAIDGFLQREYRGLFYNVIYRRYFENPKHIRRHQQQRFQADGALSPWDAIVKRHAEEHGFDWRLIVALMYQESRFDPAAESFAGAVGLLQVLPGTAEMMGISEVRDPAQNIAAGVKYLAWLRDRFSEELSEEDRLGFVLASYNAGPEHVRDARRLAESRGLNQNRWFDHVEEAIQLLSRAEYARLARHGYCRGSEPVNYVREVLALFKAYREATGEDAGTLALGSAL